MSALLSRVRSLERNGGGGRNGGADCEYCRDRIGGIADASDPPEVIRNAEENAERCPVCGNRLPVLVVEESIVEPITGEAQ
jgi:hypothetical protein